MAAVEPSEMLNRGVLNAVKNIRRIAVIATVFTSGLAIAHAQGVRRIPLPNGSKFPIALAVEVPPNATTFYLSGVGPDPLGGKKGGTMHFGNTETQTLSDLQKIKVTLKKMNLNMGDIIHANVYLAGSAANGGKMDFTGLMKAWDQYFGTKSQPNLPSRSAFQVAALAVPGWLVEIEVIAVKP